MFLYNITVIIDESINDNWLNWINQTFIPELMDSNLVVSSRLLKVVDSPNEGFTYCIQLVIENKIAYQQFQDNFFLKLMQTHAERFNNRFVSFSTLMEFIDN